MGQKVNPHGLRVGVIKDWDSRWYARNEKVGDLLVEDYKLRNELKKRLYSAGVPKIEIERDNARIRIYVHCARPGMVIGKGGEEIEKLRAELEKRLGKTVDLKIVEVKNPDINAQLVAENIAQQLEKRIAFRRAMKNAMGRAMRMGALGIKVHSSGRLNGAEIARTEHYHDGTIPLQTLRADIEYGFAEAATTYGRIGIKVWIYKGEVLTQVVDKIVLVEEFDAMCVFDADNLVDGQFLARMNDALVSGAQVAQGFRDSKNPEQSAISGCYSICYWMLNRFYNGARSALHLSALVNGSGFAVTTALLRRLGGWHTVTMTEDYEFSAQCAMLGERVHFVPEALIYDEQPLTFRQSWKQRRRWTTGSLQGLQVYGGLLFRETVLRRSAVCFDMTMTFLTPFVQLASTVLGIAGAALVLAGHGVAFGGILLSGLRAAALMLGVGAAGTVLGTSFAAALTVVLKKGSLRGVIKGVATFWLFALSHMALTLLSFVKKERTWRPIAHTNTARIEDLTA